MKVWEWDGKYWTRIAEFDTFEECQKHLENLPFYYEWPNAYTIQAEKPQSYINAY